MNVHLVAIFRFKENYMMDAIELLKKLVIATRSEAGCIQYDLAEDMENKGVFFITEIWETQEHHFKHSMTEHVQNFRENATAMLLQAPELYRGNKMF